MHSLPFALLSLALGAMSPVAPSSQNHPIALADAQPERLAASADPGARLRVDVTIQGRGPYGFVVDTGSERTVISRELAAVLQLGAAGQVTVTSLAETSQVPSAVVQDLRVGRRVLDRIHAPTLPQQSLGADGLLGLDSLQQQHVLFDFRRQELTVGAARGATGPRLGEGEIVVRGRPAYGRLILTDASLDGQRVTVVVDTGSEVSVGNQALRAALLRRGRLGEARRIEVRAVTGAPLQLDYVRTSRIRIGSTTIRDLPIAFGSAHLFERLNLSRRPAILLGMDALQLFDRVAIDFANRRLRLLPPHSSREEPVRLAGR